MNKLGDITLFITNEIRTFNKKCLAVKSNSPIRNVSFGPSFYFGILVVGKLPFCSIVSHFVEIHLKFLQISVNMTKKCQREDDKQPE